MAQGNASNNAFKVDLLALASARTLMSVTGQGEAHGCQKRQYYGRKR